MTETKITIGPKLQKVLLVVVAAGAVVALVALGEAGLVRDLVGAVLGTGAGE